jgi:hypothetical protein
VNGQPDANVLRAALEHLLAAETILFPWQSIQPPRLDFITASDTHAESALLNSIECGLDCANHGSMFTTLLKKSLLGNAHDASVSGV